MSFQHASIAVNGGSPDYAPGLRPLVIEGYRWRQPLIFMLTLALCGLRFFPAIFLLIVLLIKTFKSDRYQFTIMLMLALGCYGITDSSTFIVKGLDLTIIVSIVLFLIMYKTRLVRKLMWVCIAYAAALIAISTYSVESFSIQFLSIRNYAGICCFIIPVAIFAGRRFEIGLFFEALMPYALLMCIFYFIDAFILKGNILVPRTFAWGADSSFLHPVLHPFSMSIFRKYPMGMVFVAFAAYPAMRYYRLNWKQWTIFILGLISTQTFTVILAFVLLYSIVKGFGKYIFATIGLFIALFALAYFVDSLLPVTVDDTGVENSTLRIKSSINQFLKLKNAADVEDIAKFGSGRMAQLIPNLELVSAENKEWTGLGFIHPDYSNIARYKIVNVFFTDVSQNEIMAGIVEINPAQIYIYAGLAGLIVVYGFYLATFFMVRRLRFRGFYCFCLFLVLVMSLGNYATVSGTGSILALGFSLGVVCLANRPPESDYIDKNI